MKKIFTLFVAFLALTFCAKAQVTIILEAHDVWEDGTGYQLLLDADHNTYGTVIPETGGLTDGGDAPASAYAEFEYKVPVNADGSMTTQNIVYDGSQTITIPAGTYDFCITNPTPGDRIWIAGGGIDPTRADDYVFQDGATYHFLMSKQGGNDACTITVTFNPTMPTIVVNPTSVNFGGVSLGETANATVNVSNFLLTAPVTASTEAPFSVSIDGITYGTTATVPVEGGTLYVKYAPVTAANHTGAVTFASEGANTVTVALSGSGIDCGNVTIPYVFNFDNEGMANCWTIVDANEDEKTFIFDFDYGYAYYLYDVTNAADDWLISPTFTLDGTQFASVDFAVRSSLYPEKFQVFAIGNDTVALTDVMEVLNTDFETLYLDLSSLNGNYKIAFHCVSDSDKWVFYLTNFNVSYASMSSLSVDPDAIDFGIMPMNTESEVEEITITALGINDPTNISVAAPFLVSLDNETFAANVTIPVSSAFVELNTVYVKFAPTAEGPFTQNLTVTAGTLSDTVSLTGEAVDCSGGIATVPYLYDFNTGTYPPMCWYYGDAENYWDASVDGAGDYALGISGLEMLITPEIHSTSEMAVMFDYRTYLGYNIDDEPTVFRVGYTTSSLDAADFTWLPAVTVTSYPDDEVMFFTYAASIPANAKHVAIDIVNMATYYGGYYTDAIYIDNFRLVTDSYLAAAPESIDFGSIVAGTTSEVKTVNVVAAMLNNDIAVTAPGHFQVSNNGTSFATNTTIPATGGVIYVRYTPEAAGTNSGAITLTSGSLTETVTVSGSAIDCSTPVTLPFTEDFESELSPCWDNIDYDEDGYTWYSTIGLSGYEAYEGEGCYASASYNQGVLDPDNWLITPALVIPSQGAKLTWFVAAQDPSYPAEYYEVKVSTSKDLSSFTTLFSETLESSEWEQRTVNINGNYANQNVYIAFRHTNGDDQFVMKIDNINVTPGVGVEEHTATASIYPNPATNVLNVNATSNINNVEVYNMMGQMVGSYDANDMSTQINTSSYANGVYTIRIQTEEGVINSKFTVAR
jgi:hypothetical protein